MTPPLLSGEPAVAVLELVLPFPPSVNRYYRNIGYRTLLSREGREYRRQVCSLLAGRVGQPLSEPLEFEVHLYPPDRGARDLDNFASKAIWDALQHAGVFVNDRQIKRLTAEMHDVDGQARAEIALQPLSRATTQCRPRPAKSAIAKTASAM